MSERGFGRTVLGIVLVIIIACAIMAAVLMALDRVAGARDLGQWKNQDAEISTWFRGLMQPDTVRAMSPISCCGPGDAYWADETRVRGDQIFAVITDDRPDGDCGAVEGGPDVPCRIHEVPGTEYQIPPDKIIGREQLLKGNPTGHVIIFLAGPSYNQAGARERPRQVLCYVMNGGV